MVINSILTSKQALAKFHGCSHLGSEINELLFSKEKKEGRAVKRHLIQSSCNYDILKGNMTI